MNHARAETDAALRSSYAQAARTFVLFHEYATLSSLSRREAGYPFGSVVPYDIDPTGVLVIFVSVIAEHYRNLRADPRASLFVADGFGSADPQANPRITILGEFLPVPVDEVDERKERYWRRFPESPERNIAHNFALFSLVPRRVRWIAGFGAMDWIDGKAFREALHDDVAYCGQAIVAHMNEDHPDALADYLRPTRPDLAQDGKLTMVGINRDGFTIAAASPRRRFDQQRVFIPFTKPLDSAGSVRDEMIELLRVKRAQAKQEQ